MAKTSKKDSSRSGSNDDNVVKVKRTRKSVPRDSPPQRSSVFRGVTRHRWTGRYEAHLWDKNSWNEAQSKKGRQVYLGAYDDEEAAAHAYDLAALKYWGQETILNFPLATYEKELKEMEGQSKEEYIGSLRRKSSGFSRGVSKYRGVARHHHNGRWEARIGRVFGNKYLYLGTYATQEEAATAYDMAAIEYRGLNAVTNFDLSRYVKWLRPDDQNPNNLQPNPNPSNDAVSHHHDELIITTQQQQQPQQSSGGSSETASPPPHDPSAASATSSASTNFPTTPPEPELEPDRPRRSFPDDIQTYFDCDDSSSFVEEHDIIFGDLSSFDSSMFHCELDA
ncbi:PREDICTED: AP2-like ethylene-responsive transcription factor At1g16060 [Ipomoea nil]|uniref:AP2-like ethylene-responsive transcription factor At1g16060 n=1 Tax=Ipomoea nil TaxID=35883 RepID=UPI000901B755|nr:PREDICTED: AP2-like ethylene-responsive transcription factor At1g16060 [Ipomoea nil]